MRRALCLLALSAAACFAPCAAGRAGSGSGSGRIVYTRREGARYLLHVMNADGTGDRELAGQTENVHLFPTWSPDGKQIACMAGASAQKLEFGIHLVSEDGSGEHAIRMAQPSCGRPA